MEIQRGKAGSDEKKLKGIIYVLQIFVDFFVCIEEKEVSLQLGKRFPFCGGDLK